jgi:two-component system OmpR family sensor kinase
MLRTLYGKLTLALLALLTVIGVLYILVTLLTARIFLHEVNQNLDRDVAAHLVSEVPLMKDGRAREEALEEIFHMMMVVNPSIEIYLLDAEGRILAYSAPPGKVQLDRIPLEPVKGFLEGAGRLPVTGADPRHPGVKKAFSAAPILKNGRLEGYLYVVLGGEQYDSAVQLLQASFVLRLGIAALIAALLFAFVAGLLVFYSLTRRLRRLAQAMEHFQRDDFSTPVDVDVSKDPEHGDEIDRLGSAFETMSDRMVEQLGEVKRSDSLRRELVANVSHDLRTPLASLRGYLETLLLKKDMLADEERDRYLEAALQHSESLGNLVAELFELAKLESRETRPRPEPFAIGELVQDVMQKFRLEAETRRIALRADGLGEQPFVVADIGLVERALENLIDNALKYTGVGGEVTLRMKLAEEGLERLGSVSSGGEKVTIEVADTGIGIAPGELPHIFDRFYRSKTVVGPRDAGAGLGLAISKRILELHDSELRVDSELGEGTTFAFDLAIYRTAAV